MKYLVAAAVLIAGLCSTADASIWYRVTFTGDTLLNNVFVDGVVDSTAADNDLYDGARFLGGKRSYWESDYDDFNTQWDNLSNNGYVFDEFNLWGFDGKGKHWGEDYKPLEWLGGTGPTGWEFRLLDWSWGTPPEGYHTLQFPGWFVTDPQYALGLDDSDLASKVFTVDFLIDPNDAWWNQDTQGDGDYDALNDLEVPILTMWFGGWITEYVDGDMGDYVMYQGNFIAGEGGSAGSPQVIPEPSSIAIWSVIGAVGLGIAYRRRRKQS